MYLECILYLCMFLIDVHLQQKLHPSCISGGNSTKCIVCSYDDCAILSFIVAYTEVRLYTGGAEGKPRLLVPDHGFVRHNQIDDYYRDNPRQIFLAGITSFDDCCSHDFTTSLKEIGWWFFPNGTEIPKVQEHLNWIFFTSRHHRIVFLYRRGGGASGIHRCDIPVSVDVNETFYVGLYPSGGRYTRLMHVHKDTIYTKS